MYSWMMNPNLEKEWNDDILIVPPNEGEAFVSDGNKQKVIVPTFVTNNHYGLYDIEMAANARGPKLHYHKLMDETFIVREGTLTVLTAKGELTAKARTAIHIPKLSVHGYNNDTDNIVKMTMIFNPGLDREDFFRKMYKMLEENPNDLQAFQNLYLEMIAIH
ncbi:cupin domain-containing protein [Parapedobacter sp. GCM10030251]|uniref:cupin domain-containing protein n=1 Tax=Parapedobacter sp. GCM10030251 TaxID=3273419 RepID=UPI0036210331